MFFGVLFIVTIKSVICIRSDTSPPNFATDTPQPIPAAKAGIPVSPRAIKHAPAALVAKAPTITSLLTASTTYAVSAENDSFLVLFLDISANATTPGPVKPGTGIASSISFATSNMSNTSSVT